MFPFLRHLLSIVPAFLLLVDSSSASAGWMGFRNDTNKTLIVQESVPTSGGSRASQPQKIFANETIRDNSKRAGGFRTFTIFDSANPDKPLYTGQFAVPGDSDDVLFLLKSDGKGGIAIETVRQKPLPMAKAKR